MPHKFTLDECKRGGWSRARQKASWRRDHPTSSELEIRQVVKSLGHAFYPEYEIYNEIADYPQWIDVYLPDCNLAIEVDGSHSWHDKKYPSSKMYDYDQAKELWCSQHRIKLLVIHEWQYAEGELQLIIQEAINEDRHDLARC